MSQTSWVVTINKVVEFWNGSFWSGNRFSYSYIYNTNEYYRSNSTSSNKATTMNIFSIKDQEIPSIKPTSPVDFFILLKLKLPPRGFRFNSAGEKTWKRIHSENWTKFRKKHFKNLFMIGLFANVIIVSFLKKRTWRW